MSAAAAREALPQKFSLQGKTLVYDTETDVTDGLAEITEEDVAHLRDILKQSPEISELQLNSVGGSVYAGEEIAGLVLEYGLDTLVDGTCISACVDVFLAGERRRRRWATPFEFGSWIYEDTQREVYEHLSYMVARGVEPGFAIETLRTDPDGEWYPSRLRLIAAGVLRELRPGQTP
ncbi:hypothetical protein KUV26_16555 [Leisingera daeponensis]|uniref:Uncharacterized protein n=1 Tax=Leisingera daeponensis TaxID=405746 RepID=A0ABS7NJQ6_9RHOB|nr:hypothetical protein [Leisingera daeponensis]MBY6141052.1 hypothetical protein [Leisingera daeponensis]